MNLIRCNNCNRIANSIFLDVDGNCLGCSIYYGYDNRKEVFDKLVTNYHPFGWTWEEWETIAEQLSTVDFGCEFKDGCIKRAGFDKRACCSNCASMFGYLKGIPTEALSRCLKTFIRGNGFWRPDGCSLPWQYRSPTCLSYRCPKLRENESKDWIALYKAVGLGEKEYIPLLERLPKCP